MPRPTAINLVSFFYPIGNTPAVCLTQDLPPEDGAQILLLGCGNIRNVLFTAYTDASPSKHTFTSKKTVANEEIATRQLDMTCCDIEGAIIARNILAFTLLLDDINGQQHSSIWQIYYHMCLDDISLKLLQFQANKLSRLAETIKSWKSGAYGKTMKFCDEGTLRIVKQHWVRYAISDLSKKEETEHEKRLQTSFEDAMHMKEVCVGTNTSTSGLRAAAPASAHAMHDTGEIFHHYWNYGTTDRNPTQLNNRRPNPTLTPGEGDSFTLHFATDPQIGFPTATAYVPLTKESPLVTEDSSRSDIHKITDAARTHFQAWAKAFRRSAKYITLRFFVGDAIAFCYTLQHINSTGSSESNWYRDKYTSHTIKLSVEDLDSTGASPSTFNIIDTSNLLDPLGPLNLLVAAAPLLKRGIASTMYSEILCGSFPTMSLLLGLVPIEYWTGVTAVYDTAECAFDMSADEDDTAPVPIPRRLIWKNVLAGGNAMDVPERKIHFDPKDLAILLHRTYQTMFEHENTFKLISTMTLTTRRNASRSVYTRSSFAAFLRLVRNRIATDWDKTMQIVLESIATDQNIAFSLSYYQDLCVHISLFGVCDLPEFTAGCRPSDAAKFRKGVGSWKSLPEVVCITLEVPRNRIQFITSMPPIELGSPNVHCAVQYGGVSQFPVSARPGIFADVQLTFGDLTTVGEPTDDGHQVLIKQDLLGWSGKAPLLVSFNVPTWVVLHDPSKTIVTLGVQTTPQTMMTFIKKLGFNLIIHETDLQDNKRVHITRFPPHHTGFASVSAFTPSFEDEKLIRDVKTTISANVDRNTASICGLTGRLDIHSEEVKAVLQAGYKISLTQLSPTTISITIGNHVPNLSLTFPVPVLSSKSQTRIARKSSYIEIIVPFADHTSNKGFTNFMYPLSLRNNIPIVSNMPYLNLNCLPIIDVTSKTIATGKTLAWLNPHTSLQFSTRERLQRDQSMQSHSTDFKADARTNFKGTLFSMFMLFSGLQGDKRSIFIINDPQGDGAQIIILVSRSLLDIANHTVVLDCAILPLINGTMKPLIPFLEHVGTNVGSFGFVVDKAEMKLWREVIPALVERCRTWRHKPDCAYTIAGKVPLSTDQDCTPFICSCGEGKFPDNFTTEVSKSKWNVASKLATRVAISPTFAVAFVESPGELRQLRKEETKVAMCRKCQKTKGVDVAKLLKCSKCLVTCYCSVECQRADWKQHKRTCKSPST
ncbi:hypothetical protein VTL71DRAFT_56 [Oculimacula yallundae]|uniref:MYND-type domain-containing protein n=1 Tax=Oculimacula yallundae TaxID=86028 RepID=A0ABR4CYZ5_9HELO